MKVDVQDIDGKKLKSIELPEQFTEEYEPDLIKRAVLAIFSRKRQPYGAMKFAGKGYSSKLSRRRRDYKTGYGKGMSRIPRKTMWRRGTQFNWVGTLAPGTVGGRRAHPPKAEKDWTLKINNKERKKAIRSALSGVASTNQLIIIENKIESFKKLKETEKALKNIGIELTKVKRKKAGRGKSRGRREKYKKNPLIIVSNKCDLMKAASNLPGVDITDAKSINASLLTIGHDRIRPCIFTEGAIEKIEKENLFR